jgi:hypothetical protein
MMPTQKNKSTQSSIAAKWWLAVMGIILFSITVAPDYPARHVLFGVFIVVGVHLIAAMFRRRQPVSPESVAHMSRASNALPLMILLPLAAAGMLEILVGGSSAWHPYFCALAIGSFTAMCRFFPRTH